MTVGSLFSGIGGFDLGLERAGMHIEWQVENNDYCRRVLQKHWPKVPCHYDIKAIDWEYIPRVDLICGGFPCQPFSLAGKRRGQDDDRYLWPEVVRCLSVLKPTWFVGENVPGLINLGLDQVCIDLEGLGYETATLNIPACAVDAPHIRQRLWIVAHANESGQSNGPKYEQRKIQGSVDVADAEELRRRQGHPNAGRDGKRTGEPKKRAGFTHGCRWPVEPSVCRVADGVPDRMDRLKGLGNAIVPQIAEAIGRMILELEKVRIE